MTGIHLDVRAINHIWQRIMRLSPSDRHYLVLKLNEYQDSHQMRILTNQDQDTNESY